MAANPQLSVTSRNTMADAVCALLNNGFIRIYSGAQPANADTAITTQILLAELRWASPAFAASAAGAAIANAITSDTDADASGTAAWFRALKSDGTTAVFDGSVGTSSADMILATLTIIIHTIVAVSGFTYTQRATC